MQSGTTYCCPGEGEKKQRKQPIEVEGVSVSLVNDGRLKRFMASKAKAHTASNFVSVLQVNSGRDDRRPFRDTGIWAL